MQISEGRRLDEGKLGPKINLPPIHEKDGIIFFDEKHSKCRQGSFCPRESLVCQDENGRPCLPEDGGKFPDKKLETVPKFGNEARALAGVGVHTVHGQIEGFKTDVYNYTERKVVGAKTFEAEMQKEIARAKKEWTQKGNGNGYEGEYGPTYRTQVKAAVDKKHRNCNELIDFIWEQSKAAFKGTNRENTFTICHDHLITMWTKEGIEHMKSIGMWKHIFRIQGESRREIAGRYYDKVVGNSPDLNRGTDAHGFADWQGSIEFHSALTMHLPIGDPRRFSMGTPNEVFSTMERTWLMEPTNKRIIYDIEKLSNVLEQIIDAKGKAVHGLAPRPGNRYIRFDGKGENKHKTARRDRKDTLTGREVHPDASLIYEQLIAATKKDKGHFEQLLEDMEQDDVEVMEIEAEKQAEQVEEQEAAEEEE